MELKDIIKFVLSTEADSDIAAIKRALEARKERDAVALRCELTVGQTVWLKAGKPRYLNGAEAKIVKINRERVVINLSKPHGRFCFGVIVPVGLISTTKV